ncbi:unnamed protein product [Brassica rapa subsp. trilocularis]
MTCMIIESPRINQTPLVPSFELLCSSSAYEDTTNNRVHFPRF